MEDNTSKNVLGTFIGSFIFSLVGIIALSTGAYGDQGRAKVDAYLENVWRALRETTPVSLSHRNATALAGELYRAWADGGEREKTIAIVHTPGVGWQRDESAEVDADEWLLPRRVTHCLTYRRRDRWDAPRIRGRARLEPEVFTDV